MIMTLGGGRALAVGGPWRWEGPGGGRPWAGEGPGRWGGPWAGPRASGYAEVGAAYRSRSATFSSSRRSQLAWNVVSTVSRQRWTSSATLAQGPISATSSTSAVGTAAIAPFLSP